MRFALPALLLASLLNAGPVPLFDGKSLDAWSARAGEEKWWRVEDGMIVGGSLTEMVPHNTFLASAKAYGDFELRYKLRLVKGEGFMNSGMQIRSRRVEGDPEMIGYQVDAGPGYWGDLYDESRRNIALAKSDEPVGKDWEWNEFRVVCEGPRIRTWINGVAAIDFTEPDAAIPRDGLLGLQAHGGGKLLVQLKDISIDELPATADGARTPQEQGAGFTLPAGYTAELVASEVEGVGKPVTVTWDRHGRMWTMTALEYPVDANENEDAARELFRKGGADRVLVFDEPNAPGPQTPRVFAAGLAIPLGLLPEGDAALVQHGDQIRRYRDADGDGSADGFEVVLEGFGIQDSHLFVHQFERAPGGWNYLAQGAFNYSNVRRPGGLKFDDGSVQVEFNHCKLARFRPDGSAFEALTAGPNNIWGLDFSRHGETYIQEANDLGHPVSEFIPGAHYPTGFGPKLRPDAPQMPPSTPGQPMGGTGLSGIALAQDAGSPFAEGHGEGEVFYVANPITSRIQIVSMTRDAGGHPVFEKGGDFMTSDDPWFRPIAIRFGPDGCLYIVDWYNKIISHNEVPRTHPDRDKTRGRIWRIRHRDQTPSPRLDLAALADPELIGLLDHPNARIARQAWLEISDRKAIGLVPALEALVRDSGESLAKRLGALWALEGLQPVAAGLLRELASAPQPALRHEAVRISGENSLPEAEFLAVCGPLANEPHYRVRAALANAVRTHREATPAIVAVAARLGREPLEGDSRGAYDRNFERYLARWAMSVHPAATRQMLKRIELPAEARILAVRSFDDSEAAEGLVALLPEMQRPLSIDELALLGSQLDQAQVQEAFAGLLAEPERREAMLRAMISLDPGIAAIPSLASAVQEACRQLLERDRSDDRERLVLRLTRRFRLTPLAGEVESWLATDGLPAPDLMEGLATLREIKALSFDTLRPYLDHPDEGVRREAISGLASIDDVAVIAHIGERWSGMSGAMRSLAVTGMTDGPAKAEALAMAITTGRFAGFDGAVVEKLLAALGPDHPAMVALLDAHKALVRSLIRLGAGGPGRVATRTTLSGPFTVETWIKLDGTIDNDDSLFGHQGGQDFNFYDGSLRVWGGAEAGDLIIADRALKPGVWTHCAITRDAGNRLTIYLDGEADPAQGKEFAAEFADMNIGESARGRGTAALFDEIRIWNHARSAEQIRAGFLTRLEHGRLPDGLILRIAGDSPDPALEGSAAIIPSLDFPELITPAAARELEQKFDRIRTLAGMPGDFENGQQIARTSCFICHQVGGEGSAIGPDLSGAGAMGVESLLRNILTPNTQLESGYYRHDVKLRDGSMISGFLVGEDGDSITLRPIGSDVRILARDEVAFHEISRRSLMPEGLIDGFTDQQVADLFAYLKRLR